MNILITGGTGLIGRHFIKASEEKHTFTVLTRKPDTANKQLPNSCVYITSLSELDNLNSFDAVINLAGEPIVDKRWTTTQKRIITESRLETTKQLAALIENSADAPKVFISGSAIGFYGRQNDQAIDEQFTDVHQEFSHQLCAQWEAAALSAASVATRVCILRTGIVLAPNGGALSKMLLPFKLGLGGPIGNGKQYMSWIHIDDMVKGIQYLLDNPATDGIYNFTAPQPETNKRFAQTLCSALGRPCLLPMPSLVLKTLMGEGSDLLIYGQNVVPKKLLDEGFSFAYPKLPEALENILT